MEKLQRPNNIHHQAFLCRDAEQTRWFYEDIMGFKLVAALDFESSPGSGEPLEYMHLFFEMGNGDHIAFFDIPDDVGEEKFEIFKSLTQESSLSVNGEVVKNDQAPGGFELIGHITIRTSPVGGMWVGSHFQCYMFFVN